MATISTWYNEESTVKNVCLGAHVSKLKMPKEINLDKFGSSLIHIFFPVLKVVIIKHPLLLVIVCCYRFSFPQEELRNYPGRASLDTGRAVTS